MANSLREVLTRLLGRSERGRQPSEPAPPRLLMTTACLYALQRSLEPENRKRHEGVAYLFGLTSDALTLAASAFRPAARTSPGSFEVTAQAMAACVRAAARHRLQVVAQVHTHPRQAFHSEGDVEGARIRYPGYVSIVLPDYGDRLPSLEGAAVFVFTRSSWVELKASDVILVPDRCDG